MLTQEMMYRYAVELQRHWLVALLQQRFVQVQAPLQILQIMRSQMTMQ